MEAIRGKVLGTAKKLDDFVAIVISTRTITNQELKTLCIAYDEPFKKILLLLKKGEVITVKGTQDFVKLNDKMYVSLKIGGIILW